MKKRMCSICIMLSLLLTLASAGFAEGRLPTISPRSIPCSCGGIFLSHSEIVAFPYNDACIHGGIFEEGSLDFVTDTYRHVWDQCTKCGLQTNSQYIFISRERICHKV